jgi:cytochrome c biogenesis protein CcdA
VLSFLAGLALALGGGFLMARSSWIGYAVGLLLAIVGIVLVGAVRIRTFTEANEAYLRSRKRKASDEMP